MVRPICINLLPSARGTPAHSLDAYFCEQPTLHPDGYPILGHRTPRYHHDSLLPFSREHPLLYWLTRCNYPLFFVLLFHCSLMLICVLCCLIPVFCPLTVSLCVVGRL